MANQQILEAVDKIITHYLHPVAAGQITVGTVQAKSQVEYALQALNTTKINIK